MWGKMWKSLKDRIFGSPSCRKLPKTSKISVAEHHVHVSQSQRTDSLLVSQDFHAWIQKGLDNEQNGKRELSQDMIKESKRNKCVTDNVEQTNLESDGNVCLMSQNPYKAHKLAAKGRVQELEKLFHNNPEKFKTKDAKGRTPLHYAASKGQISAMDFILGTTDSDIDETDNKGNTALHLTIENDQKEALEYLLKHGAPSHVLNDRKQAPIHMAVEHNKVELLEALLSFPAVDPNLGDGERATGLHIAAWKDHSECAEMLLAKGAKMCKPCRIGLYPIHVAAHSASSKTMQTMLDYAEKAGYKREDVLKQINQEKFTPLHAAIASGEVMAVRVCIEAGAQIEVSQEDGCNAVHLAAAQGATDMIKIMFELKPIQKEICLSAKDKQQMTALHKAAVFDRAECVAYLLEQGSYVNELCEDGYTPILLAASKKSWKSVEQLFKAGADICLRDDHDSNLLHIMIKNGGKPSDFSFCMCSEIFHKLLDEKDRHGCTPLHYASMEGQLQTIESLLKLGAVLNAKNNSKQSPLHFAAQYGRYNTCKRLLSSEFGHKLVNETDEKGMTPIHVAALNGHVKVVQLLLQNGAGLYRDIDGNTPLHMAAMNGYTHTMTTLLNVHPHLIENCNKDMDTPLHVAARQDQSRAVSQLLSLGAKITKNVKQEHFVDVATLNQNRDVCIAVVSHDRWREILNNCSNFFGCPVLGFIKYMPDVCQMVLDRCRVQSSCDHKSKDFYYSFDFHFLQLSMEKVRQIKAQGDHYTPMLALNTMVKYNRVDCLDHPVCLQYLKMKWCAYGMWFHLVNLFIYTTFLASLTAFVSSYRGSMSGNKRSYPELNTTHLGYYMESPMMRNGALPTTADPGGGGEQWLDLVYTNNTNGSLETMPEDQTLLTGSQTFLVYFILSFCILNAIKEVLQMIQQKWKYFCDLTNALEWVLYIMSVIFIGPFTCGMTSSAQWQSGAIAVFLAWFNLLLFLQRFDFFGIYVVMFLEILKTLVQVIIVFSVLIIAFGLSFYILLSEGAESYGYRNPALSLMTTILMMLGNIDYTDNWILPMFNGDATHVVLRSLMLIVFVLLMPILLINLLIGLAVGDIEAVQRNARLKRLAMQVELHTDIEKKLPQKFLEKVDKTTWKVYPNGNSSKLDRFKAALSKTVTDEGHNNAPMNTELDNQTYLYQELGKQKARMKGFSSDLSKQYDLLKLIVQKMEIRTEADEMDEGDTQQTPGKMKSQSAIIGWSSAALRQNLMTQAAVVQKWKNFDKSEKT